MNVIVNIVLGIIIISWTSNAQSSLWDRFVVHAPKEFLSTLPISNTSVGTSLLEGELVTSIVFSRFRQTVYLGVYSPQHRSGRIGQVDLHAEEVGEPVFMESALIDDASSCAMGVLLGPTVLYDDFTNSIIAVGSTELLVLGSLTDAGVNHKVDLTVHTTLRICQAAMLRLNSTTVAVFVTGSQGDLQFFYFDPMWKMVVKSSIWQSGTGNGFYLAVRLLPTIVPSTEPNFEVFLTEYWDSIVVFKVYNTSGLMVRNYYSDCYMCAQRPKMGVPPMGLSFDPEQKDVLYIASGVHSTVSTLNLTSGIVTSFIGKEDHNVTVDGQRTSSARLRYPSDLVILPEGVILVSQSTSNSFIRVFCCVSSFQPSSFQRLSTSKTKTLTVSRTFLQTCVEARFLTIETLVRQSLAFGEVEVFVGRKNIARNQLVASSSIASSQLGPQYCIDGLRRSTPCQTQVGVGQWFRLDWGRDYCIDSVAVFAIPNDLVGVDNCVVKLKSSKDKTTKVWYTSPKQLQIFYIQFPGLPLTYTQSETTAPSASFTGQLEQTSTITGQEEQPSPTLTISPSKTAVVHISNSPRVSFTVSSSIIDYTDGVLAAKQQRQLELSTPVKDAVTSTAAIAVAVSTATGGISAASDVQVLAVFGLMSCATEEMKESFDDISWTVAPVQSIGPEGAKEVTGCLILIIALISLHFFATVCLPSVSPCLPVKLRASNFIAACAKARFPSFSLSAWFLLFQGTSVFGLKALIAAEGILTKVVGIVATLWSVAYIVVVFYVTTKIDYLFRWSEYHRYLPEIIFRGRRTQALNAMQKPFFPEGFWGPPLSIIQKDQDGVELFDRRDSFAEKIGPFASSAFGAFFRSYRPSRRWFLFLALVRLFLVGCIAVVPFSAARCNMQFASLGLLNLMYGAATLWLSPYRVPLYSFVSGLSSIVIGLLSMRIMGSASAFFVLVTTLLSSVFAVYALWLKLMEHLYWKAHYRGLKLSLARSEKSSQEQQFLNTPIEVSVQTEMSQLSSPLLQVVLVK